MLRSRIRPARWVRPALVFAVVLVLPALAWGDEPRVFLRTLEFTSDHNLIRANDTDLLSGGERYPDVEWTAEAGAVAPMTHTAGDKSHVAVKLTLAVEGTPEDTPFLLTGKSPEAALCFRHEGKAPEKGPWVLEMTATKPLGKKVRGIRQRIDWELTLNPGEKNARKFRLGETGSHTIYTTIGTPRDVKDPVHQVTEVRMRMAVGHVAYAQDEVGLNASMPKLMHQLVQQSSRHYLPTRHYERDKAWKMPESWEMFEPGASCISIIEFVVNVSKQIGVEGEYGSASFYADNDAPRKAKPGGLGDKPVYKTGPFGETLQLMLVDDRNSRQGQAGGFGGMNFYEASLKFKWDGKTYYYPGGTNRVYDNPDDVIRIFRTLAWAKYDFFIREWMVAEVVHTYIHGDDSAPPSVKLP